MSKMNLFLKSKIKLNTPFMKKYFVHIFVCLSLWAKSYYAYTFEFNLGVTGWFQKFLLFFNPFSAGLLLVAIALFFKPKRQPLVLITGQFIAGMWLYSNVVYYRFFGDFITVQTALSARKNAGQLGDSFISLTRWYDFLFFVDIVVVAYFIWKTRSARREYVHEPRNIKAFQYTLLATVCFAVLNLGLAEMDRPQLLSRTFDRNYIVKYLGLYNFAIYDSVRDMSSMTQRALASDEDVVAAINYSHENYRKPNELYYGKAEGRNVVFISLESLQNFILDYRYEDGTEITPFLNSLMRDESTFYFENIFDQAGQGKTSDAEFMLDTGLFPIQQGAVYVNKSQNVYHSTAEILRQNGGYYSASFHGNYKTFWNRNEMYRTMGYDNFFDAEYYDMNGEDVKNYGLKDRPFYEQTLPMLESIPQPFSAKLITLSNHFPFGMDQDDTDFPIGNFGSSVVDQYFQSSNYLDVTLEEFFIGMKERGLYENTIFVLYGDHHGISSLHSEAMAQVMDVEVLDSYDQLHLKRLVFMIHAPGIAGGTFDSYGGLTDVRTTVLNLLGIDTKEFISMGTDLLAEDRNNIAVFRNGDFVTPDWTYVRGSFYDNVTKNLVSDNEVLDSLQGLIEAAKTKLEVSDEVIGKDLLRFHAPAGFVPTNRDDHVFLKPSQDEIDRYRQNNLNVNASGEVVN